MEVSNLIRLEYQGKLVLTTKQLANFYDCNIVNIRQNFKCSKEHFIEGVHYFYLEGAELKKFKQYFNEVQARFNDVISNYSVENGVNLPFTKMASSLYLWTLRGCSRHCKLIGSRKAWEVFNFLENHYFGEILSEENQNVPSKPIEPAPESELTRREKIEILQECLKFTDCKNLRNKLIYDIAHLVTNKNY